VIGQSLAHDITAKDTLQRQSIKYAVQSDQREAPFRQSVARRVEHDNPVASNDENETPPNGQRKTLRKFRKAHVDIKGPLQPHQESEEEQANEEEEDMPVINIRRKSINIEPSTSTHYY